MERIVLVINRNDLCVFVFVFFVFFVCEAHTHLFFNQRTLQLAYSELYRKKALQLYALKTFLFSPSVKQACRV